MKNQVLFICAGLLLAAPIEARGSKTRYYNFAEQAIDADVIVIAGALRMAGKEIVLTIDEYLVGTGPEELRAVFTIPFRGRTPSAIEAPRVVFLSNRDGELRLIGVGTQSLWPHGMEDGREYLYVSYTGIDHDVPFLADLAMRIRACVEVDRSTECEALILNMFTSSQSSLRILAMQTCVRVFYGNPPRNLGISELGALLALETIDSSDIAIANWSGSLSIAGPKSAVLPTLLELMKTSEDPLRDRKSAFNTFIQMCNMKDLNLDLQPDDLLRTPEARARAMEKMAAWYEREFVALFASDYIGMMRWLKSDSLARRTAGRIWLRAATGKEFRFDESDSPHLRAAAVRRAQTWWEETRN